jgi:hypothetical protein
VSEKDRAAFYQAHKDDPEIWSELEEAPEPPPARQEG